MQYLIAAAIVATGCSKWLDVKPYDKIAEDDLFSTEDGFTKLPNGIYIELNRDMVYGSALTVEMIEVMGGAYAIGTDNAVWGNYRDLADYKYNTEYWRARLNETWNKVYSLILNCNMLVMNADEKKDMFTGDNYSIIKGEALALRAMLHSDMLRLFGPVCSRNPQANAIPYYTAYTTVPENILPSSEVAEKILKDLKEAKLLLSGDPIIKEGVRMDDAPADGSSNFLYYRNLRLNYYAVAGLLARASLYFGDKESALSYANEVIEAANSGIFPFVERSQIVGAEDPDKIFSSEVIFALTHAQRNTLFKDWYDPSRTPNYVFRIDSDIYSSLIFGGSRTGGNQDDWRRRANWKTTVTAGAGTYKVLVSQAGTEQEIAARLEVIKKTVTVMSGYSLGGDMGDGTIMPVIEYSINYKDGVPSSFVMGGMMLGDTPIEFAISGSGNNYTIANENGSVDVLLENGRVKSITVGGKVCEWAYDAEGHLTKFADLFGPYEFTWENGNLKTGAEAHSDPKLVNKTQADYALLNMTPLMESEVSHILVAASLLGWCGTPSANIPSGTNGQLPDGSIGEVPYEIVTNEAGHVTGLNDPSIGMFNTYIITTL